jgi:hypothetical protein
VYLPGDRVVEVLKQRPALARRSGRYNPRLTVVPDPAARDSSAPSSLIDEIVREGARRMLAEALQAEVDAYIAQFAGERDESGRRRPSGRQPCWREPGT